MKELLENKKKSEVLAEKIKTLNYGDIITHEQIAKAIDEEYPSNKYSSTIAKAKRILASEGVYLENIIGAGRNKISIENISAPELKDYACEKSDLTLRLHQIFRQPTPQAYLP